ncbi:acyl transferase [Vibrio cholerae]
MPHSSHWEVDDPCTIDHVISLSGNQQIHVWETPPTLKFNSMPTRRNSILIASGFARRMDHFAGLARYLSANGFHVYRYDSLHHVGLSSGTIDQYTMSIGKQSLEIVMAWLHNRGVTDIGVIAASLSARIAYASVNELDLSFLITAVGVVNLRDTLEKALGFDYLSLPIQALPNDLDFEGHKLGAEVFVRDCFANHWDSFSSTVEQIRHLSIPFIAFTANGDDWVKQDEVIEMLSHIPRGQSKLYSLLGSSHYLGENLVVLRNFYQSVTKAAIALDSNSFDINIPFVEPTFEQLTIATVNERRMKNQIETETMMQA